MEHARYGKENIFIAPPETSGGIHKTHLASDRGVQPAASGPRDYTLYRDWMPEGPDTAQDTTLNTTTSTDRQHVIKRKVLR